MKKIGYGYTMILLFLAEGLYGTPGYQEMVRDNDFHNSLEHGGFTLPTLLVRAAEEIDRQTQDFDEFPAVLEYEVCQPLGTWIFERCRELKQPPEWPEVENHLTYLVKGFLRQSDEFGASDMPRRYRLSMLRIGSNGQNQADWENTKIVRGECFADAELVFNTYFADYYKLVSVELLP